MPHAKQAALQEMRRRRRVYRENRIMSQGQRPVMWARTDPRPPTMGSTFTTFFLESTLVDQLVKELLLFFISKVQWLGLEHYCGKQRQNADTSGKIEDAKISVGNRQAHDFKEEMRDALDKMAPLYAHVVLQCSDAKNQHQDRMFFEAFYEALAMTCLVALDERIQTGKERDGSVSATSLEGILTHDVDRIFRTDYFNISKRRTQQAKLVDLLTISELFELRHADADGQNDMSAELLSQLYERPREAGLHDSYVATSGTISKLLNRPQVKPQGAMTQAHFDKTLMDRQLDLAPPDLSKSSTQVVASEPKDLKHLEDLRMQLIGQQQAELRRARQVMEGQLRPVLTLRPSGMSQGLGAPGPEGSAGTSATAASGGTRSLAGSKHDVGGGVFPDRMVAGRIAMVARALDDESGTSYGSDV